jgi:hypothetical protein
VARSNPRLAAGVGVVAAFLLLGGSGLAPAIADPGGSGGSDKGNSSDRDWGDSRRGPGGGADNRDSDSGSRRGADNGSRAGNASLGPDSDDAPRTRVGSGRGDTQDLSPGNRSEPSDRTGPDISGAPSARFEPPKVTVGNGRSPGVQDNDREPRSRIPAPEPAPAPPPPPPPAPAPPSSWVDRVYTPPSMPKQLGVAPASKLTDPLWGIAGLLLIPAAGAVLGYRQARAAQGAEKLRRP